MHPFTIVNIKHIENSMPDYNNFIGIDIGKFNFVVNVHSHTSTKEYENSDLGIERFLAEHEEVILDKPLFVLETTGGYEMGLLLTLCDKKHAVHRANTRQVKSFIRSYGHAVKTDALDAKALALYGHERCDRLNLYKVPASTAMELYELVTRRHELKKMLVSEKNRLQAPRTKLTKKSCQALIAVLEAELVEISQRVRY